MIYQTPIFLWVSFLHSKENEREEERRKLEQKNKPGFDGRWYTDVNKSDVPCKQPDEDDDAAWEKEKDEFWDEPTAYTPESRKQVIPAMTSSIN